MEGHDKVLMQDHLDSRFEGRVIRNMVELWPELRGVVPDGELVGKSIQFPSGSIEIEGNRLVVK